MARKRDVHRPPAHPEQTPPRGTSSRSTRPVPVVLLAGVLVAITFAAYAPAIRAGFVWDDDVYVTANPHLEDPAGLRNIWLRPAAILEAYPGRGIDTLIPLTFTTLWVEHRLWGVDPLGYHLVNIALHALAAVLLWRLLRRLRVPGAWLAAALFAVHPVAVESVAWVAELKNVQSGVLALLCLLAFFRFDPPDEEEAGANGRRRRYLVLALLLFAAALLSKSAVVPLLLVIVAVVWWKRGRVRAGDLVAVAPMLAMGAAMGLLTLHAEKPLDVAGGGSWQASFVERALVAGRALAFYVGKLVWPAGLCSIYPRWDIDATAVWQYVYPLAAVAVIAALWLLRGRLGRGPLAAALCFAAMVAPTLGFAAVNYHLYSFVADHFQYHAAPALIALFAAAIARLHAGAQERWLAHAVVAGAAIVVLALGTLTFRHARAFESEKARCLDTLAKNPSAWLASNNLAVALADEGRPEEAIPHYQAALRVKPDYAEAHDNLGVALIALGRFGEAREHIEAALRIWPGYAAAHNNLGTALASLGNTGAAIAQYREALRLKPDYAEAHTNLGTLLATQGGFADAAAHFREALRIRPDYAEAHNGLGLALAAQGRGPEAVQEYLEALRIRPAYAEAHNNLGVALTARGELGEAVGHYREALRIRPDYTEARNNMGTALAAQGNVGAAAAEYREAVRGTPDSAEAHNNLGTARASQGKLEEAIAEYRTALRIRPSFAQAQRNLGVALASSGAFPEAVEHYREALRLEPDSAEAHNGLGVALASLGRLDEAVGHFEQALRLDPANADAGRNLERARALTSRRRP